MLLIDKYIPTSPDDSCFHKETIKLLQKMSSDDSIPNIIFYGPEGSGKKILIHMLLNMIYGPKVNEIENIMYEVYGSSNKPTDVYVKQSSYHIVIDPNNNNFDRYIVHDIVKNYAKTISLNMYSSKKNFKTVLINSVDNLSYYAQTSLRRTMEMYSDTCRFVMWCNTLSSVIDPLRSRCICIRVPSPSREELFNYYYKIGINEGLNYNTLDKWCDIVTSSGGNIKKGLWKLETEIYNCKNETTYSTTMNYLVELVMKCEPAKLSEIRHLLYNMTITNIPGSTILKDLLDKLIDNDKIDNNKKIKIIDQASYYDYNMTKGRREMLHLDGFILNIMDILVK